MRCEAPELTSIKHKALLMATSSDVNTEECTGRENERVSRPATNAQPTPSFVFDPSVNVRVRPL